MLSLEPILRERLATLDLFRGVWGLADLRAEKTRPTPCAYVVYDGARIDKTNDSGREAKITARWLVVIAVKNVAEAADGAPARADAQTLALATLNALMGWRPDSRHQPLMLADLPAPEFYSGTLYLPLVFQTTTILKGN